ncbi:LicD family protein [Anaerofustis butyriciformans]|uniref:LicD family protein n=1 Tax=Anaerofustis butyriciformans TaxID=3108533 RepID=UPI003F887494
MTDIQKELYKLIKEIDEICTKNDIVYYLVGGSAIGALRHRGFIPWDDDMDIEMTRDNFHKFIEACKTQMPPNRKLACQELDRNYHNNFARYMDTTTSAIHINQLIHKKDSAGIVLDILILDPIPDDEKIQKQYIKDFMLYADIINPASLYSFRWRMNLLRYFKYRLKMKFVGKNKVLEELESKMFCYKEEDCSKYIFRWGGIPFLFDKDMYGNGVRYQFEDLNLLCPDRSADYLSWHYGDDWMFIPPHNGRDSHPAVYSFKTPYTVIEGEAYKYYDPDKTYKKFLSRKILLFLLMHPWHAFKDFSKKKLGKNLSKEFNQTFNSLDTTINKAIEQNDYFKLYEIFNPYITSQNQRKLIGREDYLGINRFRFPISIDVNEKYFDIAIELLIKNGQTSKALRFMEVKENKNKLSKKEEYYKTYILNLQKAISLYANKDYKKSSEIVDSLLNENIESISTIKLKIYLLKKESADNNEIMGYINKGEELFEKIYNNDPISVPTIIDKEIPCNLQYILNSNEIYNKEILMEQKIYDKINFHSKKQDGEFIKFKADILLKEDINKALLMYFEAFKNTENGITHLEIKDIINENIDYLIKHINELFNSNDSSCVEYASILKNIISDDQSLALWAKCIFKFSNNPEDILVVINEINNVIYDKDKEDTKSIEELKNIYSSLFESNELSDIYFKIKLKDTVNHFDNLSLDIEKTTAKEEWKLFVKSVLLYKSGYRKESIKNSLQLFNKTNNPFVLQFLSLIFTLDLLMFENLICNKPKNIDQKGHSILQAKCIGEWNDIYDNYIKTIDMYDKLNILKINGFKKDDFMKNISDKNEFNYSFFNKINNLILNKNVNAKIENMVKFIYDLDLIYDGNN